MCTLAGVGKTGCVAATKKCVAETASLIDASRWRLLQKADRRQLWFLSCWELLASEVGQLASASADTAKVCCRCEERHVFVGDSWPPKS